MEAKHTQNINNTSAWHKQNHQGPVKFLCYCFVLPSSKNKTLWFAETRHNKIEISKAQKFVGIRAIPNWFLPDQFWLGDTGCCTSYCTLLSQLCRGLLGQASFQLEGEKGQMAKWRHPHPLGDIKDDSGDKDDSSVSLVEHTAALTLDKAWQMC